MSIHKLSLLFLSLVTLSLAMSRPPSSEPNMELVRVVYKKDFQAIVIDWIISDFNKDSGRVELLIYHHNKEKYG